MSTSTEISRILSARNTIRNKLVNLGLSESTDLIDALAADIDAIANRGAPNAQVTEGESYTILPGYYSGGSVQGVAGGGSYTLQEKSVTPTKQTQAVAPDAGYYGLSGVTVAAIPAAYQDVSSVTAVAGDVLTGKIIVTSAGTAVTGSMPNVGAVNKTLDATTGNQEYTVPTGYHNGSGKVKIVLETKTATPTTSAQNITPTSGKVLSRVTVNPIPSQYIDTSDATAQADEILDGKTGYVNGVKVTGTMTDNATITGSIDGLVTTSYTIPAGYTSGGSVSLTNDIETALAAI